MKKIIASILLLTTSAAFCMQQAAFCMQQNDTAQKHIDILKEYFSTSETINAYHSPEEKITHIFTTEYDDYGDIRYKRYYMHKDKNEPALHSNRKMRAKDYKQALRSFELMNENQLVTKLPLD
jgi:hypothetical protein